MKIRGENIEPVTHGHNVVSFAAHWSNMLYLAHTEGRQERGRANNRERQRRHLLRHPGRTAARRAVGKAVKEGRLIRQPCERCGTNENVEAHHADYSKKLEVKWFCKACHEKLHAEQTT